MPTEQQMNADDWYAEVVRLCQERGYAEWFYSDVEAWLGHYQMGDSPQEAVDENYDCLL